MIGEIISTFQKKYPPMFKEGEGWSYSLDIFRSRILSVFWTSVAVAISFLAVIWIVPENVTSSKDWMTIFWRGFLVLAGAFVLWRLIRMTVDMERERIRLKATRAATEIKEQDYRQFADFAAGVAAIVTLGSAKESLTEKVDEPEKLAAMRVSMELAKASWPKNEPSLFESIDPPFAPLVYEKQREHLLQCYAYGFGLTRLMSIENLQLVSLTKDDDQALIWPETAAEKLRRVASAHVEVAFKTTDMHTVVVSLSGLVKMVHGKPLSDDHKTILFSDEFDANATVDQTMNWLKSIKVGVIGVGGSSISSRWHPSNS